jgi:hypothetical protein
LEHAVQGAVPVTDPVGKAEQELALAVAHRPAIARACLRRLIIATVERPRALGQVARTLRGRRRLPFPVLGQRFASSRDLMGLGHLFQRNGDPDHEHLPGLT